MQKKHLLFVLLVGLAAFFGACTNMVAPNPFSEFSEHKFNDILTSLDNGRGDTLLVGTANGKIIFFNTNDATSRQEKVGNDRVYFVRQDTLPNGTPVTFVGVRNEGLKVFKGHQFSNPDSLIFGFKNHNYSVYKVEHSGNWLICATSNGLAKLDLLNLQDYKESLQALCPDTVQQDYKISAIQRIGDTLYASHDTLIHIILLEDKQDPKYLRTDTFHEKIQNLYDTTGKLIIIRKDSLVCKGMPSYKNSLGVHSCLKSPSPEHKFLLMTDDRILMGNNLSPDSLTVCQLTLANEQYIQTANIISKSGFTYFISGSSLCQIPDYLPREKHITAISENRDNILAISDQNEVYSQTNNFHKLHVIRHNSIKDEINQAISLQNKLCVLSGGSVFFYEKDHTEMPLPKKFDQTKITRMFWDSNNQLLFFAYRNGFAYGEVKSGHLDTNNLTVDSFLLSVQCFAQRDKNTLYIGTLNNGCKVWDLSRKSIIDSFATNRTNITDILLCKEIKKMFVLTPTAIYTDSIDGHTHYDSIENIDDLYINRIYPLRYKNKPCLLGISKLSGLYVFDQNNLKSKIDTFYPDILFYPDAIHIEDSVILAGTSLGLVKLEPDNNGKLQLGIIKMNDPFFVRLVNFFKKHIQTLVNIGLPVVIALILLVFFLTIWSLFKKKKIKELDNQNVELNNQNVELNNQNVELNNQNAELKNQNVELNNQNAELNNQNAELNNQNVELNNQNDELKNQNVELNKQNDELNNQNVELNNQNVELNKQNVELNNQNVELNKQNVELNKQNVELNNQNVELNKQNVELNKQNDELNKQNNGLRTTKEQFEKGREVIRNNVLGNILFKEERNIQSYPMTESIKKLKDFETFLDLKHKLVAKINNVKISQYNFYQEMQYCAKTVQEKLWEPSFRLDELALRNWVIQYHQELLNKQSKYVSIFRDEIDVLSEKIHEAVSFSSRRDEETCSIYLKMWAAALLLHEPTPQKNTEESDDAQKDLQKEQKEEQGIILKLMKPQNLYPLLFDENKLSRTNFDRKKANLLNDFEEMESYKGNSYETRPVFVCENAFLVSALEKLRKA